MFYRYMCRCLKVKSLLSQADGSEEKVYEKVRVVNLAFYKTIDDRIRRLVGEFKDNFGRGGKFERSNLKKFKCPGEGVGLLKLRIDRRRNGDFTES